MKIKFTWGHAVVFALLGFIAFILTLIFFYAQMPETFDLVTENYYEEELNFQHEIDAFKAADTLSEPVSIHLSDEGVTIRFPKVFNSSNTKGLLHVYHPSKKMLDIKKKLVLDNKSEMFVPAKVLSPAIYTFRIKWEKDHIKYRKDFEVIWK